MAGRDELAVMLCQMSAAIRSGMTVHDALKMLEETSFGRRKRRIYRALASKCAAGMALSDLMATMPHHFPRWLVGTIRAGERSGRLAEMLELAAEQCEWNAAWRRRWRWIKLYQSVCLLTLIFALPLPRVLIDGFQWYFSAVVRFILPALVVAWLIAFIWRSLSKLPVIDAFIKQLISLIPLIDGAITHNAVAKFLLAMAQALDAGMSATEAIEVSSEAMDVPRMRARATIARKALQGSASLSDALSMVGILNAPESSSVRFGERTGTVVQALMRIASERQNAAKAASWMLLIIQLAILHLAIAAGIIYCVYSVYQAMFEWVEREFKMP